VRGGGPAGTKQASSTEDDERGPRRPEPEVDKKTSRGPETASETNEGPPGQSDET
jgi:hypothetical protein